MADMTPQDALIVGVALAIVAALVLTVDFVLVIAWLWPRDATPDGTRTPVFARKWSLVDPWIGGQAAVALLLWMIMLAMMVLAGSGANLVSKNSQPQVLIMLIGLILQNALLVAIPVAYLNFKYGERVRDIGFSWLPTRRQVAIGAAGGIALILAGSGVEAGISAIAPRVLPGHVWATLERLSKSFSVETMFPDIASDWLQFAGLFVAVAIAAPIGEEFFFRGFLHNSAKRRLGVFWGTLVSATAFALVHGGPLMVVAILPMGVILAVLYDRTGSLWVPIIVHAVNNGAAIVALRFLPEGWR